MRAVWKKVFKNLFSAQCEKFRFSEKCQKVLDFDNALWPNHSSHNKAKGIYGKMISISFIWHPGVWNMPTGWVTMAQGKSWPHVGRGKKWVIRPYPLACPWIILAAQLLHYRKALIVNLTLWIVKNVYILNNKIWPQLQLFAPLCVQFIISRTSLTISLRAKLFSCNANRRKFG